MTLRRVNLRNPKFLIGGNKLCDLRVDDEWIHRQRTVLFRTGRATIVVDLKRRNGVFVNARRVSQQVLIDDDIITLGDQRLKFIDPSARRRTTLPSADWDEVAVSKSIREFRRALTKQLKPRRAS